MWIIGHAPLDVSAQGLGIAGPGGCYEDHLEPNPFASPTVLTESGEWDDLNICTSDDWYRVDLLRGQEALFELRFFHADGDIDVTLHTPDFIEIDISDSASDFEVIRYVAARDATLFMRVYGYGGAANAYSMSYRLTDYSFACVQSDLPDEIATGQRIAGRVCIERPFELAFEAARDVGFEAVLWTDPTIGDLDMVLLGEEGRTVASSTGIGGWERIRYLPEDDGPLRLVVSGHHGDFGPFELALSEIPTQSQSFSVAGRIVADRRIPGPGGLVERDSLYPEGILVEAIRGFDGHPIARTVTDESGGYRLRIDWADPDDVRLVVWARLETAEYRFEVIPAADSATPHFIESENLGTFEMTDGMIALDVDIDGDSPMAGAFSIAAVVRSGFEAVLEVVPHPALDLQIVWDQGVAHSCGSCYSGGQILLAGGPVDTDEFDAVVILHELGHFIQDQLSWDDSPGGSHDGSRTSPLVAFGEGIATAFAMLVRRDPLYIDTVLTGSRAYEDLERVPFREAFGTSDGTLTGRVSEWTTAALIWDLFDRAAEEEPFDDVQMSRNDLFRVMFDHLLDPRRRDLGATGLDLADWLESFRCAYPAVTPGYERLVFGHARYPINLVDKAKCDWLP
jgi:hypothetical protein